MVRERRKWPLPPVELFYVKLVTFEEITWYVRLQTRNRILLPLNALNKTTVVAAVPLEKQAEAAVSVCALAVSLEM